MASRRPPSEDFGVRKTHFPSPNDGPVEVVVQAAGLLVVELSGGLDGIDIVETLRSEAWPPPGETDRIFIGDSNLLDDPRAKPPALTRVTLPARDTALFTFVIIANNSPIWLYGSKAHPIRVGETMLDGSKLRASGIHITEDVDVRGAAAGFVADHVSMSDLPEAGMRHIIQVNEGASLDLDVSRPAPLMVENVDAAGTVDVTGVPDWLLLDGSSNEPLQMGLVERTGVTPPMPRLREITGSLGLA